MASVARRVFPRRSGLDHRRRARALVRIHCAHAFLRRQAAHLKQDRRRLVIVKDDLRARRLAVVVVAQAPAEADNARRQRRRPDRPAADVDEVNPVVAKVAIARRPEPMPVVMQPLAPQLGWRRRAAPEVVIDRLRERLRTGCFADAAAFDVNDVKNTYDSEKPTERLDYIFYNTDFIEYAHGEVLMEFNQASDHLPLLMKFKLK